MQTLPAEYNARVAREHRRALGQFFTDARIARFMVQWVLAAGARQVFDPGFGLGTFYFAGRALAPEVEFTGVEIDPVLLAFWREQGVTAGLTLTEADYLQSWGHTHAAVVCNPPYMRFQKFQARKTVSVDFAHHLGVQIAGHTNLASAFLLKSIAELRPGGRLAYVMPLEFLNTGYGTQIKRQLLAAGRIHALIQLDCEQEAFPDVITSVGILLFEKGVPPAETRFYVAHALADLDAFAQMWPTRTLAQAELHANKKWLRYFEPEITVVNPTDCVPFTYYGAFQRGIATGANAFFVLKPSQVAALELDPMEVVRCVTRGVQVRAPVFTDAHWETLRAGDAPVYLFNAGATPTPAAQRYIQEGVVRGYDLRYLTRARDPWYRIEVRRPAPLLIGPFAREGYKVVRNYSSVLSLTCFHGFQPNAQGADWIDQLFLYCLSRAGRQLIGLHRRNYGAALDKYEPNDLNQAWVPSPAWFARLSAPLVEAGMHTVATHGHLLDELEALFAGLLSD